ncbi:hypothetical protein FQN57_006299 [Myotisia sp. PD_48]|nr:hypothetical protein FQN57_006299 [Myotisia sp. PD_48]
MVTHPEAAPSQSQAPAPTQQHEKPFAPSQISNSSKLLIGGTAFFMLSAFITRRSLVRRQIAATPAFYTTASHHQPKVSGAMEALEALNLATINVVSVAIISVGAGMKISGIETLEDLRRKVRGGIGVDGTGRSEKDVEEDMEEWIVSVLNRKAEKEKGKQTGGITAEEEVKRSWTNERGKDR